MVYLLIAVIAFSLLCATCWRWWKNYKFKPIDDEIVAKRQRYYLIAMFFIFMLAACIYKLFFEPLETSDSTTPVDVMLYIALPLGFLLNHFGTYHKVSSTTDITNVCLYLRPFKTDGQTRHSWQDILNLHEPVEKLLCDGLRKYIAHTYAIGNPSSSVPTTLSTINLYANDSEWKDTIAHLSKNAYVILIRVGESEGCLWEINHCIENNYLNKVIFLIENVENLIFLNKIHEMIPLSLNQEMKNKSHHVLYFDENFNDWKVECLNSKSKTRKFIKNYLVAHPNLSLILNNRRKNNRIFSRSAEVGSTPAIGWQIAALCLNPIMYCIVNRWSTRWAVLIILYLFPFYAYGIHLDALYDIPEAISGSLFIGFLPWFWLAPRISWRYGNWGSRQVFKTKNRAIVLSLLAFGCCLVLIDMIKLFICYVLQ